MESNNKIGITFFIILLLLFVFGGYFLMQYMINNTEEETTLIVEPEDSIKIDEKKDYLYYDIAEEIVPEVYKEDVIINIKGFESTNSLLHNELEGLTTTKEYYTNQELSDGITCDNNIYSFNYREYEDYTYNNYITLYIKDNNYICGGTTKPINIKSIVIDKNNGKKYTEEELLTMFNKTNDDIISSVRERLNNTQLLQDSEQIDIEGTINALKNTEYGINKALGISKNGKLLLNFIVISSKINYNDSIEI